jgi:phage shock protein PspC (stress-responsive transcriptional regulator)
MNKVITINLNGRAYQLEEDGFAALSAYLDDAKARLAEDPGKAEIIADLEQAIAEKCDKTLSPHKNVVASDDIKKIITEMGPVEGNGSAQEAGGASDAHSSAQSGPAPKRLYRIEEGAMIWGVANGLAAFFGIDVVLIRIVFVILTLITGGGFALAYFAMMILIPEADTMQEKAAAHGEPFNAQELVNRVKSEYANLAARLTDTHTDHLEWRKLRHELKKARKHKQWRYGPGPQDIRTHHTNHLLGILRSAIAIIWVLGLLSLITTGALFGWAIPVGIPIWVAIILLFVLYYAVTGPMRSQGNSYTSGGNYHYNYHYNEWDGIGDGLSILFLAIAFGWAYLHVPQFYYLVHHPILSIKDSVAWLKQHSWVK